MMAMRLRALLPSSPTNGFRARLHQALLGHPSLLPPATLQPPTRSLSRASSRPRLPIDTLTPNPQAPTQVLRLTLDVRVQHVLLEVALLQGLKQTMEFLLSSRQRTPSMCTTTGAPSRACLHTGGCCKLALSQRSDISPLTVLPMSGLCLSYRTSAIAHHPSISMSWPRRGSSISTILRMAPRKKAHFTPSNMTDKSFSAVADNSTFAILRKARARFTPTHAHCASHCAPIYCSRRGRPQGVAPKR